MGEGRLLVEEAQADGSASLPVDFDGELLEKLLAVSGITSTARHLTVCNGGSSGCKNCP